MNYSQPRGISLMEVMVAVVILAITATAVVTATTSSMRNTRLADETRAASFAARKKMEELLSNTIGGIKIEIATKGDTFEVYLNDIAGGTTKQIELLGPKGLPAGEVILIEDELADPAMLGRDLSGGAGPDGVTLCPLPMDFNGNGTTDDAAGTKPGPVKLLVGVVIRWTSTNGLEQRYELWSVR